MHYKVLCIRRVNLDVLDGDGSTILNAIVDVSRENILMGFERAKQP